MLSLVFPYISNDSSPILFSLRGSRRDCIGNILTFILIFTINVFHCFLKIHSQNDSILLPVDLLLSFALLTFFIYSTFFSSQTGPYTYSQHASVLWFLYNHYHFPPLKQSLSLACLTCVFTEFTLFA